MNQKVNLIEYIHPQMDILFLALNAPQKSNTNQHWFSGSLSFWNVLYRAGLITEAIYNPLAGDETVFKNNQINFKKWIYGVTDLNREVVQTDSTAVRTNFIQVKRILVILDSNIVKKLCLLHSKVASQFVQNRLISRGSGELDGYGVVGKYKDTVIYKVPFHNASIPDKHKYYALLKT